MKRLVLGALLLLGAVELPLACSTKVPLASINSLCEYDEQCAEGLACRCVRRRNPDDEGPDEIIRPGLCQTTSYRCATDGGVTDAAEEDTGATVIVDSAIGSDADAATGDAADGD